MIKVDVLDSGGHGGFIAFTCEGDFQSIPMSEHETWLGKSGTLLRPEMEEDLTGSGLIKPTKEEHLKNLKS